MFASNVGIIFLIKSFYNIAICFDACIMIYNLKRKYYILSMFNKKTCACAPIPEKLPSPIT